MGAFAFIVNPSYHRLCYHYRLLNILPEAAGRWLLKRPLFHLTTDAVLTMQQGSVYGKFYACPLTEAELGNAPERAAQQIIQAAKQAAREGAMLIGLDEFAPVSYAAEFVSSVAQSAGVPVTNGCLYTAATTLAALPKAVQLVGRQLTDRRVLVLGRAAAAAVYAESLAEAVPELTLAGTDKAGLSELAARLYADSGTAVLVSRNIEAAVRSADVVVTVGSAAEESIEPTWLRRGAIVCDAARPRRISRALALQRRDVLIYDGAFVKLPCLADLGWAADLPRGIISPALAEAMLLASGEKAALLTQGDRRSQIAAINELAAQQGMRIGALASLGRPLANERIAATRLSITEICR